MSLLKMYGFNHVNQAVQADGITPVNGVGLTDSGYNLVLSNTAVSAWAPAGVVSDTNQAMGKAPKRQPLVFKQLGNASAPAAAPFAVNNHLVISTGNVRTGFLGFRFAWDYDGNQATVNGITALVVASFQYVYQTSSQSGSQSTTSTISIVTLNPQAQTITVAGSTFSLPPGVECYIEVAVTGKGQFNGDPTTGVTLPTNTNANFGYMNNFGFGVYGNGFNTPQNSNQWGLIKFCDIYVSDNTGAAPWNSFIGQVKIIDAPFDTSVSNTMAVSPSGISPVDAIASANDDEVLVTTDGASQSTFGYSALPAGLDTQVLAIQSVVTASKDSGFTQSLAFADIANGTTGTSIPITLSGVSAVATLGTLRTALADGTALSGQTFTDYELQITSTP